METKNALRQKYKNIRKTLDGRLAGERIAAKIRQTHLYKEAKNVMLFYPTKFELDLRALLSDSGKNFYFPKVSGEKLDVCPNCEVFRKSKFNIWEPCSDAIGCEVLDLVIVPALAVDKDGYRLGYGGGFYDRFLKTIPKTRTLTPIFKELFVDELPHEDFDVRVDLVVTD